MEFTRCKIFKITSFPFYTPKSYSHLWLLRFHPCEYRMRWLYFHPKNYIQHLFGHLKMVTLKLWNSFLNKKELKSMLKMFNFIYQYLFELTDILKQNLAFLQIIWYSTHDVWYIGFPNQGYLYFRLKVAKVEYR